MRKMGCVNAIEGTYSVKSFEILNKPFVSYSNIILILLYRNASLSRSDLYMIILRYTETLSDYTNVYSHTKP